MIAYWIELSLLIVATFLLVRRYSEEEVPLYVKGLVWISWSLTFIVIMILPLDIYEAKFEGYNHVKLIWIGIYYANFVLTWLVLPIAQEYENAGEFTFKGKLRRSLINNGLLILIFLIMALGLVVYLIATSQLFWTKVPSVLATTANLFGIAQVVVLLGHGLVSLPKFSLRRSSFARLVEQQYRQAELVDTRHTDTYFDIEVYYRKLNYIRTTCSNPIIQERVVYVTAIIPYSIRNQVSRDSRAFDTQYLKDVTEDQIASINRIVKRKVSELRMYSSWLNEIVDTVARCNNSVVNNSYRYRKWGFLSLFVCSTILNIIIFIGQLSTFVPFMEVVNTLVYINEIPSAPVVYIMNSMLLLYIVYIITHSIFEMKVFGMYSLHPNHSTAASLLFTSVNLSRVSYPLCYNYLQITGMPKSAFLDFFGEISIGDRNTYLFPILLIVFALFNLFDIYDRIMTCFGLGNYAFNPEDDAETKREGKKIIEEAIAKRTFEPKKEKIKGNGEAYMELGNIQ